MKHFLPIFLLFLVFFSPVLSQDFTGQWKGKFVDKSSISNGWGGDSYEYVLDISEAGNKINGSSYTYFIDAGTRYYTICAVEGTVDKKNNYVEIREVRRTKTNVPEKIRNCFQVHKLFYKNENANETLTGSWIPAPGQNGDCGHGLTMLQRRALRHEIPSFAQASPGNHPYSSPTRQAADDAAKKKKQNPPIAAQRQRSLAQVKKINNPKSKPEIAKKSLVQQRNSIEITPEVTRIDSPIPAIKERSPINIPGFQVRNSTVLQTIVVSQPRVQVDLYDNGEIDGDSISLFYNSKLILAHQRLSDRPISLVIDVDNYDCSNELVMYAENLGTIPPNTALMIVTDGPKRYEVRITSDLKKSGAIRFKLD